MTLFDTGIRPTIDDYLHKKSLEVRSYGEYWSASSAGYCHRKLMFERLGVPPVSIDPRRERVFESGKIFHEWVQRITKESGLSIAQELELQDEDLMIRGHIDDLVLIDAPIHTDRDPLTVVEATDWPPKHLILYDYKTAHSRSFTYTKDRPISYFHRMQVGTYMYMLRKQDPALAPNTNWAKPQIKGLNPLELTEARVLSISKDDLRMAEKQVLWDGELENDVLTYWKTINKYWAEKKLPSCTCADHENGFMAKELYNPYFYDGEPCSLKYYTEWKANKKEETNVV